MLLSHMKALYEVASILLPGINMTATGQNIVRLRKNAGMTDAASHDMRDYSFFETVIPLPFL